MGIMGKKINYLLVPDESRLGTIDVTVAHYNVQHI